MAKVTITLDDENVDTVTSESLESHLNILKDMLDDRITDTGFAVFEDDKELDIIHMKDLIEAFEKVIEYV